MASVRTMKTIVRVGARATAMKLAPGSRSAPSTLFIGLPGGASFAALTAGAPAGRVRVGGVPVAPHATPVARVDPAQRVPGRDDLRLHN